VIGFASRSQFSFLRLSSGKIDSMFDFYIVTSVLNAVDTIDRTIWSIVSQQGNIHIHYHVQDAGSTDGTLEKLAAWQKRMRNCEVLPAEISFSFVSEPDNGLYDGVHRGFERLNIPDTAFMAYLNGDDMLWPGAVAAIAQVSEDLPDVDWLMG
jgi:glycosyltransferase involved in cell wall biosynthesis